VGIIDHSVVVDQLHEILVTGDKHGLIAPGCRVSGQSAHDVVGFIARFADERKIEGVHKLLQPGQLFGHILGHALPLRLVLRIDLVTEGGFGRVKDHSEEIGFLLVEQVEQDAAEAEDDADLFAARIDEWIAGEGEIGAIGEGGAIDEKETFLVSGLRHRCSWIIRS